MEAVLDEMQRRTYQDDPKALIFPSPRTGGPVNGGSCVQFLRNTLKWKEQKIDVHGFRSTLTDWCHANGFAQRLIDRRLDHVVGDKVAQAYGHDQHIEERRAMMRLWGDYCARPEPEPATRTDNVLSMNAPKKKGRKTA